MPIGTRGGEGRVTIQLRPRDELKRQLMTAIQAWIKRERLTQREASRLLGVRRPEISNVNANGSGYSLGSLLDAWVRIGGTWQLDLKHERTARDFTAERL